MAKTRAEIIRDATLKARADWVNYVELQNKALYDLYQRYADQLARELARSEYQGKVPPGAQARLNKVVRASIPPFRKAIAGSINRGISRSVDYAFMAQILSLDAGGIANRMIQLGSSFIDKSGKVVRWNAAKETFLQSTWSRMNKTAVDAVKAWKPGGLAFSDRVWDITYQSQKQMLRIIQQGVMDGKSAAELSRELRSFLVQPETLRGKALKDLRPGRGVYKSAYKNAMRLARTELNRAFVEGTYRYGLQKSWIDGYYWRAGSADPCPICAPDIDRFFPKDEPPDIPAHPHCLVPGQLVRPAGDTLGATCRHYRGEVVTIKTAGKHEFTCTPNHPILTADGWVPAGQLNVGSDVLSCGQGDGWLDYGHDVDEPSLIEDIAETFSQSCHVSSVPMPVAPEDFHGDGIGSEIAVVSTYSLLRNDWYTELLHAGSKLGLIFGNIARLLFDSLSYPAFGFPGHLASAAGGMGGLGSPALALGTTTGHSQPLGLMWLPEFNTETLEALDDGPAVDAELISQTLDRSSGFVQDADVISRERNFLSFRDQQVGLLMGPNVAASRANATTDRSSMDPEVAGDLAGRLTGLVTPDDIGHRERGRRTAMRLLRKDCTRDRIVHIESSMYEGPVYNLMTTKGYYFVGGVSISNCRCYPELHIEGDPVEVPATNVPPQVAEPT